MISRLLGGLKGIGDSFKFAPMHRGATGEFQFLLKDEGLLLRIARETLTALGEFIRNPRAFISALVRGEGTNLFRRNAMLAGSELALTGFFTVFVTMHFLPDKNELSEMSWAATLGYFLGILPFILFWPICFIARVFLLLKLVYRTTTGLIVSKVALDVVNWSPIVVVLLIMFLLNNCALYNLVFPGRCVLPVEKFELVAMIPPTEDLSKIEVKAEKKPVKEKTLGGSKPKPQKAGGGGGGGRQRPEPPSKGKPPQMSMNPPIVLPNPEPPKIPKPVLPVPMSVQGDVAIKFPKGPIGDPTGVPAPPSPGPGTGGGIGRSSGTGVGGGTGGGVGPGRGGNIGGGDMNIGGGRSVETMTASLRPTILYREKAKYTEEARQNKIQGTVVLQVVFNVNGSITDIRVVRSLPDGLTEKAIEAARKIRFNPAVKNGTPVSVRGTLEFTFNLY